MWRWSWVGLVLAGVLGYGWWIGREAEQRVMVYRQVLREAGLPGSYQESVDRFHSLDRSKTRQWMDILDAESATDQGVSFVLGQDVETTPCSGETWVAEGLMREFEERSEPLIRAIAEADTGGKPVWLPMQVRADAILISLLSGQRGLARIVNNRFALAVHDGDAETAMEMLRLAEVVADAFDYPGSLVALLINSAVRQSATVRIGESLRCGLWSAEQLDRLADHIERNLPTLEHLREIAVNEFLLFENGGFEPLSPQWMADGIYRDGIAEQQTWGQLLRNLDRLALLYPVRSDGLVGRPTLESPSRLRGYDGDSFWALPSVLRGEQFWNAESIGERLANHLRHQRERAELVRIGIEAAKFEMRQGRWPESTRELEMGVTSDTAAGPMFEIRPASFDGVRVEQVYRILRYGDFEPLSEAERKEFGVDVGRASGGVGAERL